MAINPPITGAALGGVLLLLAGAGAGAAPDGPFGSWLSEDIRGGGVIDRLRTTLEIKPSGEASGSGGCNRFRGAVDISGAKIVFGPLVSTRMACVGAIADQEQKFFKALEDVKQWERDEQRRKLSLRDADGREILLLSETK